MIAAGAKGTNISITSGVLRRRTRPLLLEGQLDRAAEFVGRGNPLQNDAVDAGSADLNCAIAEKAAEKALIDVHLFDIFDFHLLIGLRDPPSLHDNAAIAHGDFQCPKGNDCSEAEESGKGYGTSHVGPRDEIQIRNSRPADQSQKREKQKPYPYLENQSNPLASSTARIWRLPSQSTATAISTAWFVMTPPSRMRS
jgi:hypothetical protein